MHEQKDKSNYSTVQADKTYTSRMFTPGSHLTTRPIDCRMETNETDILAAARAQENIRPSTKQNCLV